MSVLALLWSSLILPLGHTSFSAHMLLHLGLILVAAPLLAVPIAQRLPTPTTMGEAAEWYLLAAALETVTVSGWHVPALHDATGYFTAMFVVEQASFLASGVALWTALFTARTRISAIFAALVAALTFSHMSMFGLLLALVPHLIYDPDLCRGWAGFGGLDDQHLGGALMAAGGLAFLGVAVVFLARAIHTAEDRERSVPATAR